MKKMIFFQIAIAVVILAIFFGALYDIDITEDKEKVAINTAIVVSFFLVVIAAGLEEFTFALAALYSLAASILARSVIGVNITLIVIGGVVIIVALVISFCNTDALEVSKKKAVGFYSLQFFVMLSTMLYTIK